MPNILVGCSQWDVPNNTEDEIDNLRQAIKQVSKETKVDARFILAVALQESSACVRAPTTRYDHRNPGLLQSHDGKGTCNENKEVRFPCPADEILTMIRDGVAGTVHGDGLVQMLSKAPRRDDMKYYQAARMYNSGEIDPSEEMERGVATHCYVSDIANRLTGWSTTAKLCNWDNQGLPSTPEETTPAQKPNSTHGMLPWLGDPSARESSDVSSKSTQSGTATP